MVRAAESWVELSQVRARGLLDNNHQLGRAGNRSLIPLETLGGEALGAVGATTCCRERPRGQGIAAASGGPQKEEGCFCSRKPPSARPESPEVQTHGASQAVDGVARQATRATCCSTTHAGLGPAAGGGSPGTKEDPPFSARSLPRTISGRDDEVRPGESHWRRSYGILTLGRVCCRPGAVQGTTQPCSSLCPCSPGSPRGGPGRKHGGGCRTLCQEERSASPAREEPAAGEAASGSAPQDQPASADAIAKEQEIQEVLVCMDAGDNYSRQEKGSWTTQKTGCDAGGCTREVHLALLRVRRPSNGLRHRVTGQVGRSPESRRRTVSWLVSLWGAGQEARSPKASGRKASWPDSFCFPPRGSGRARLPLGPPLDVPLCAPRTLCKKVLGGGFGPSKLSKLFKWVRGSTKVWDLAVQTTDGWAESPGAVADSELRAWSKLWKPGPSARQPRRALGSAVLHLNTESPWWGPVEDRCTQVARAGSHWQP
eukprot:4994708-Amphidinium_carterae.2